MAVLLHRAQPAWFLAGLRSLNKHKHNNAHVTETATTVERDRASAPVVPRAAAPAGSLARMVRAHWKVIAAITLVTIGLAWILAAMQPDMYRASALAAVAPVSEGLEAAEVMRGVEVLDRRTIVATVAALAGTNTTRTRASVDNQYNVEAVVLPNTNLFRVDVEGADAGQAAAIANRLAQTLNEQTRAMYKYYGVTMVSPADTPASPFSPRPSRAIATGLLLGLLLGLIAAYVLSARAAARGRAT